MEKKLLETLELMSNVYGTSGHEDEVIELVKKLTDERLTVKSDPMNNTVIMPKGFDENKPFIILDGHLDEVGLMVQAIRNDGLMKIVTLGGWQLENLLSQSFMVKTKSGKYVRGVVASIPPHFKTGDSKFTEQDILVDVGVTSKEEVLAMGIELGAPMVPDTVFSYNEMNDIMMGKAFDDRLGSSIVIELMNYIAEKGYTQVLGLLSAQEEMGLRGARVLAQRYEAEFGLCFEGTPADDTVVSPEFSQGALGKGVQLRLKDGSAIINPKLVNHAIEVAKENNVNYQVAVRRGGGTNAGAYHLNRVATPTIVLGVAARYIHSHIAVSKLDDMHNAYKLGKLLIDEYCNK